MTKKILLLIDIQKEYQTPGRSYFIPGVENSLANASRCLAVARTAGWEVIHVRHLQDGELFGKGNPFSDYVSGFEPRANECEFIKGDYSCYSSSEFATLMKDRLSAEVYIIGYGSTKCCLATIVDGFHRGQKFFFISDASDAKPEGQVTNASLHQHATVILKSFCSVVKTSQILAQSAD